MTKPETVKQVLERLAPVLTGLTWAERRRVLEDSITLYRERGHEEIVHALEERLAIEPPVDDARVPASLTTARITRDAPETVAQFASSVSFEDSPGCTSADCRAFVLGAEVGILHARLDARPQEWNGTYHAENSTMLERVAAGRGYSVTIERSPDPVWVFATFVPLPSVPRLALVPDSK